jgi:tetratricopeptide (TPR) repeat protein
MNESQCETPETLRRMIDDELSPDERSRVEEHVQNCARCEEELDRIDHGEALIWRDLGPEGSDDPRRRAELLDPAPRPYVTLLHEPAAPGFTELNGYEIRSALGSGMMGTVYLAYERRLDRFVALKLPRPDLAVIPAFVDRFLREARTAAAAISDHIVRIHHVGEGLAEASSPYLVMEYIDGGTLARRIEGGRPLPPDLAADIARQVTLGLAAAHARGLVHRDVKPSNILIESATGRAKLADFGLARAVNKLDPALTRDGALVGSPAYASPEQVNGGSAVDARSDLFGLGVVLYEILTGARPFQGSSTESVLHQVIDHEPVPPRRLVGSVPRDLETICLKCLEKEPHRRYESASALAEDLRRYLGREPTIARPLSPAGRLAKWARRQPWAAAFVAACITAALLLIAGALSYNNRLRAELARTIKAQQASEESRKRAQAVLGFLKDGVLAAARPEDQEGGLGVEVTVRKAIDAAEPRIAGAFKDQPIVEAEVRDTLGTTYLYLSEAPLAIPQLERVVELRRTMLGVDHPDTLRSRRDLAMAYLTIGRTTEAIELLKATLGVGEAELGSDSSETLATRSNLAAAYRDAGRIAEAVELHESTFKLFELKFGTDHPDTLTCRNDLAETYRAAGRYTEAVELSVGTLSLREAKLGPNHPETLRSRNNLGLAYWAAGQYAEAIRVHDETLRLRESKLGPDHSETLRSRNNLAVAYWSAGQHAEAIRLHETTLKLTKSKLGLGHPDTFTSRNNLAAAYLAAGRTAEAIGLFGETLKLREAGLGADHPDTLTTRNNLAEAYRIAGRAAVAVVLHEATLKVREAKFGADHPDTFQSRNNLALAYEATSRWSEAETLRRDTLSRRRKTSKPDSPLLALDLDSFGGYLLGRSRWSEAEPLLRESLAIRQEAIPNWRRYHTMSLLGGALLGQGRYREAEPLIVPGYEGMKDLEARIRFRERPSLREAAERVVHLYEAWGKPEQAAAWKAKLGMLDLPADVFAGP